MKHTHIREEMMVDYVLGNLSRDDHFKVRSHIKQCQRCTIDVEAWENVLHDKTEKQPSPTFKQRLLATIKHWQVHTKRKFTYVTVSLCMALVIALVYSQLAEQKPLIHEGEHKQLAVDQHIHDRDKLLKTEDYYKHLLKVSTISRVSTINQELLKNEHIHLNKLAQHISHSNKIPLGDHTGLSQQSFMLQDGSICSIDPQQMRMQCVMYTIDKNNKIIPVHSKTLKLMDD